MIFYEALFKSSLGAYLGDDNLEINIFTAPKESTPAPLFLYSQSTHGLISVFSNYGKNKIILENIDLKKGPFFVVSHDPTGEHNAVIADNIGGPNYVDN